MSDEPVMQIGEVATRTDLSLRSLRHWEEVGLLEPTGRSDGGFRLYTEADVDKILVIRRMKPLGFTLDQMKSVMDDLAVLDESDARPVGAGTEGTGASEDARAAARDRLGAIHQEAVERRERLVRQLDMADEFLGLIASRRG